MLASITPLGERARNRRWGATAAWYAAGSLAGGATVGAVAGAAGALIPPALRLHGTGLAVVLLALVGAAALIEVGRLRVPLPSLSRQVNENWLDTYRGWVIGAGFGFQLGLAVVTIITSPAVHVMLVLAAFTHSIGGGIAIGAAFGVARALPLLATRQATNPDRLAAIHRRMHRLAAPAHTAVALSLAAVGAAAVLGSIG